MKGKHWTHFKHHYYYTSLDKHLCQREGRECTTMVLYLNTYDYFFCISNLLPGDDPRTLNWLTRKRNAVFLRFKMKCYKYYYWTISFPNYRKTSFLMLKSTIKRKVFTLMEGKRMEWALSWTNCLLSLSEWSYMNVFSTNVKKIAPST